MHLLARVALIACLGPAAACQDGFHLYFGHGGHASITQPKLPAPELGLTVECWFQAAERLRSPVPLVAVQNSDHAAADQGLFELALSPSNSLTFALRNAAGQSTSVAGLGRWLDGAWHRATATWDGAALRVYVDGKQLAEKPMPDFAPLATSSLPMTIGPSPTKKVRRPVFFDGCIGGVRIWNRGLTQAEVAAGTVAQGCIASYPLQSQTPTSELRSEIDGAPTGEASIELARSGWLRTTSWFTANDAAHRLDFYCYDLGDVVAAQGRRVLLEHRKKGQVGVLWQDDSTDAISVTWVQESMQSHQTHALSRVAGMRLAGGTSDDQGNIYYLTIQDAAGNRAADFEVAATMHRAQFDGQKPIKMALDVSKAGLNIYDFNRSVLRSANLRHSNGTIGVILPRRMHKSADGLRHQGAIALVFSCKDLQLLRNHGQTSGHSMANHLTVNKKGRFLALDLGDNYPRGVHLHEFDKAKRTSRLVYTFKTAHATRAKDGIPVYDEISSGGRTFYKWSNDNAVYTELGGLFEDKRSYSIVFATDRGLDGRVLDNSRAFGGCNDPRNLALVRVVKDFGRAANGSEIDDALMASLPRKVVAETGGYFDFSGRWHKQRVVGVTWLTQYTTGESAHAPQLLPREDGNLLLLWEKSGGKSALHAMVIEPDGTVATPDFALPFFSELNRQDRVLTIGGRTYVLATDRAVAQDGSGVRLYALRD